MPDCIEARWWTAWSEGCAYSTILCNSAEGGNIYDYRPELDRSGNA